MWAHQMKSTPDAHSYDEVNENWDKIAEIEIMRGKKPKNLQMRNHIILNKKIGVYHPLIGHGKVI